MKYKYLTWRQLFAGIIMGMGTAVFFQIERFWVKVAIGIPLWLVYSLILNLENDTAQNRRDTSQKGGKVK